MYSMFWKNIFITILFDRDNTIHIEIKFQHHKWFIFKINCIAWIKLKTTEQKKSKLSWIIFIQGNAQFKGLAQDCNNSIVNTLELLQSCTKPSKSSVDSLGGKEWTSDISATSELQFFPAHVWLGPVDHCLLIVSLKLLHVFTGYCRHKWAIS